MFVSVTRLRLRSVRFFPGFAVYAIRSSNQLRDSPGYLQGAVLQDARLTFWTATLWADEASMKRYRGTAAHAAAMPRLAGWCDEASVAHWSLPEGAAPELPGWAECYERMLQGRLSRVNAPSPDQLAFRIPPPEGRNVALAGPRQG